MLSENSDTLSLSPHGIHRINYSSNNKLLDFVISHAILLIGLYFASWDTAVSLIAFPLLFPNTILNEHKTANCILS